MIAGGRCFGCNQINDLFPKFIYSPAPDEPICMVDVADDNAFYSGLDKFWE